MSTGGRWYGIFLGNRADALAPRSKITAQFMAVWAAAGRPLGMAIFSSASSTETGHEVTLYFSPAAESFAKTVLGSAPTTRPPRQAVALEAGDRRCWNILYPDKLPPGQGS